MEELNILTITGEIHTELSEEEFSKLFLQFIEDNKSLYCGVIKQKVEEYSKGLKSDIWKSVTDSDEWDRIYK